MTRGRRGAARPAGTDDGFTLVETMVSIFLVGVVMAALTSFFVGSLALINRQSGMQTATQVAADALATVRSIKGSALAKGRDQVSSGRQWNNPQPGVDAYLAGTEEVSDPDAAPEAGATAGLPTGPVTVAMAHLTLQQYFYLGSCWQPLGGGACTLAKSATSVPFYRVVVAVTWPDRTCANSLCSFVTATLVSNASTEPLFNVNDVAAAPVATNPGSQSGYENAAVNLQLSATGGASPTSWSVTGLPAGVVGDSGGLLSGTLAAAPGTYSVTATVTDAFGLAGSTTFTWTVKPLTYPMQVAADGPWAYYRGEDALSAAATPAVADSSGNGRTGTANGATDGPSTWWSLNAGSGGTAADSSGAGNTGTLTNSPAWVTGTGGTGLSFNGSNTSVQGAAPAVHTDQDFSAAAWAYLASTGGGVNRAVISQNGTASFGYALRYDTAANRWAFAMANADTGTPGISQVSSTSAPSVGRWVHLAGTYDAGSGTMTLYVDGVASGTATRSGSWDARGVLQAGALKWNGSASTQVLNGRIDEIRVYQRVLSAPEATSLATDPPTLQWDFSEGTGTGTADAAGGDTTGTLTGPVAWAGASNGHAGNAVSFTGDTASYVTSAAPGVRTAANYTVAAWVYLTSTSADRGIVSQSGSVNSAITLGYVSGRWIFGTTWADSGTNLDYVLSTSAAATNTWVHLAGVQDTTAGTITLYVNGVSQGSTAHTAAHTWNAPGGVEVGRNKYNGSIIAPWVGRLDSVRLYQRALNVTDVVRVAAETPAASIAPAAPITARMPGALQGPQAGLQSSTAVTYGGTVNGYFGTTDANPNPVTVECWFRAPGTGGVLIGFNAQPTGAGDNPTDRNLYLDSAGRLSFGLWTGSSVTAVRSPAAYNDGSWHHAAASVGPGGQRLYVDGQLVASSPNTLAENRASYWRWGGLLLGTLWPNRPATMFFTGSIDEVAIYHKQLSGQRVADHYQSDN